MLLWIIRQISDHQQSWGYEDGPLEGTWATSAGDR